METRKLLTHGIGMDIGDGHHTEFWNHKWLDGTVLAQQVIRPLPEEHRLRRMRDYWQQGLGWDWTQLAQFLPTDLLKQVASFELMEDEVGDKPI